MQFGLVIVRLVQLGFGAIVLGVAASVAVDFHNVRDACQYYEQANECRSVLNSLFNSPQPSIEYAAFTGAWAIFAGLITLVAAFVDAVPGLVSIVLDVLTAIFYLAGGINNAVQRSRDLLFDKEIYEGEGGYQGDTALWTRWTDRWTTTTVFMFLGFLTAIAALAMGFTGRRSMGGRHGGV